MNTQLALKPVVGSAIVIAASTVTANGLLTSATRKGAKIRIVNGTTAVASVRVGVGAQTATTADLPIAAGDTVIIENPDLSSATINVAVILATGTGNVYASLLS